MSQVAGRAGRGPKGGEVIIQTRVPTHHAVQCAVTHDYLAFVRQESPARRDPPYPPAIRLANIIFSGLERGGDGKARAGCGRVAARAAGAQRDHGRDGGRAGAVSGGAHQEAVALARAAQEPEGERAVEASAGISWSGSRCRRRMRCAWPSIGIRCRCSDEDWRAVSLLSKEPSWPCCDRSLRSSFPADAELISTIEACCDDLELAMTTLKQRLRSDFAVHAAAEHSVTCRNPGTTVRVVAAAISRCRRLSLALVAASSGSS